MTPSPGEPTGGRFADIRIGRPPRVGVEKPALPAQHWVPSARLGSDRTRRTQAAPPANGKFDRARGPTQAPYSANSHRRIPPCSFHNLCQTADPVASPDEEGLASDAPLLPKDISVAKTQAGLHIISTKPTLKTHEIPRGSTLTCVYISQSLFAAPVSQLLCQTKAEPVESDQVHTPDTDKPLSLPLPSVPCWKHYPPPSHPRNDRQKSIRTHKDSQTNIALMQSERRKETRQEQQPQKKNKTKRNRKGAREPSRLSSAALPSSSPQIDRPLPVALLHLSCL